MLSTLPPASVSQLLFVIDNTDIIFYITEALKSSFNLESTTQHISLNLQPTAFIQKQTTFAPSKEQMGKKFNLHGFAVVKTHIACVQNHTGDTVHGQLLPL